MRHEVEIKVALDGPATLRARLAEQGAALDGRMFETNRLFDTPAGALRNAGCALRVRTARPCGADGVARPDGLARATLTFKGAATPGALRQRVEIETGLDDAEAAAEILAGLGFRETVLYEKRRETWRLAGCEIAIDELPRLGWFAEIEAGEAAAVETMRRRLQLERQRAVETTYVHMTVTHGTPTAAGGHELRFRE
ncbi:MAG: class IV adenylate cyclase [Phycisphaerae bacterium]|nr:class IV adenylate cyclase [Phycisphaerae bacterium]MCZ2399055.1 class IV adenylate cyclase [Phycisphaerae bacterium]